MGQRGNYSEIEEKLYEAFSKEEPIDPRIIGFFVRSYGVLRTAGDLGLEIDYVRSKYISLYYLAKDLEIKIPPKSIH